MHDAPYGYELPDGHRGRMPDGSWQLFATYGEYLECFYEELNDTSEDQVLKTTDN